jgi:hypothetical protein
MRILTFLGLLIGVSLNAQVSIVSHQFTEWTASPSSMLSITAMNSEQNAIDVKLHATLSTTSGELVCEVFSTTLKLNSGVQSLRATSFEKLTNGRSTVSSGVKDQGILPFGDYSFCIEVLAGGVEVLDQQCEQLSSDYTEFLNLISPSNGDSVVTQNPLLIWTHSGNFMDANEKAGYRLIVAEIKDGQTAESAVLLNNPVWIECCLRAHQSLYPVAAPKLMQGSSYAWQIQRLYNGQVVQTSETWMFYVPIPLKHQDLKYVNLKKGVNSDVFPVFERLYFRFDEPYNGANLTYKIFNSSREEIVIPVTVDSESNSIPEAGTKKIGFNTYELDILQYQLEPGYYTVEIFNDKAEKYELKIKIE